MRKKLKPPTPFSGKREDLRKFLQEVKIYLLANADAYPTDLDRTLFVLSYMSEGDASSWKEEFFDSAEQKAAQAGGPLTLGKYDDLIKEIEKDFSPYDAPKDAIHEMRGMKMGNNSIEEHVLKFKMLVTKSKLAKNDAIAEYFRETLPVPLQKNIMTIPMPHTTLDDWYKWAFSSTTISYGCRAPLTRHEEAMRLPIPATERRTTDNPEGSTSTIARKTQMLWT